MKYTVEGFQQEVVVDMGLDYADVGILRWIVDFMATGRMTTADIDGEKYYWIKYGYLLNELPVLRIKDKEAVSKRLDKMVSCGLLEKKYIKRGGNYTYFRLVPEVYSRLITSSMGTDENRNRTDEKPGGYRSKAEQGTDEKPEGVPMKSRNKDSSISYPSTKDTNNTNTTTPPAAETASAVVLYEPPKVVAKKKKGDMSEQELALYHEIRGWFEKVTGVSALMYKDRAASSRTGKALKLIVERCFTHCRQFGGDPIAIARPMVEVFYLAIYRKTGRDKLRVPFTPVGLSTEWVWDSVYMQCKNIVEESSIDHVSDLLNKVLADKEARMREKGVAV